VPFLIAQVHHAGRATALSTAQNFVARSADLWGACHEAAFLKNEDPTKQDRLLFSVAQILSHLELSAIYLLDLPSTGNIRRMIEETLVDHLSGMARTGLRTIVSEIISDEKVCRHLRDFCLQRRNLFENQDDVFRMMVISSHAL
jgi:hypothetical protein